MVHNAGSLDPKMEQYLLLAKSARGRALCELINKATSEPSLFAFGELLDVAGVGELRNGEHAPFVSLLELFCYGTWAEYKEHTGHLPPLSDQQQLKLKQLTLVSLATTDKVLAYDRLMALLDIGSVRQLEDLVIGHAFYPGALRGKLDQAARCLQVHQVISRDVRPQQLPQLAAALGSWLDTTTGLLALVERNVAATAEGADAARARRAELAQQQADARRAAKADFDLRSGHGGHDPLDDPLDGMDEDRAFGFGGMAPSAPGGGAGARAKRVRGKRGWQEGVP